ncbi:DNA-formamidopyrimidine glycosylase family protein [Brachyspira hampsonii]|uniref:DNA-(apurinic or apyrimidinic site) lyase n=1 Tax=Brachyspira hampsonii 30446 TaxID=1289135 RepID=A0A2U4F9R1_9SPIR|nr:DNA-formamidopyrimidine glycosylase family protein [Brachyspira hampsonii]EKV58170.1 formamidopyrimidine-DNA glycosylase [Brachyspira hampsonii 30446]MBW5389829.1 formamidopyrimidine-DNA glycosylase [Brachyspira hampsonii]MBW5395204.1 formamidopyrimidine-DNA glycosylase [Brachyspira hampsonii]OEJ19984.1 formamidopyrimidine-DNA glycosylase [Brachyspira hampsonii]PTY39214.1 formamidopyrimidine-DNA glycosylase [Brachyspira hampsonii bv. II]
MKELPNLITLINSIKSEICYSYINKIEAIDKQYKEMEDIEGQKIIDVLRYGGYIHFQFSQDAMLIDLGPNGSFVLTEDSQYENSILKLETDHGNFFVVDDGNDKNEVTKIIPIWKDSTTMPQIGYDPLTKQFNYNLFCQLLSDNDTTVEKLIKNPLILSGIGNVYGDMILKKASITKKTKTSDVTKAKAREIFDAIKQVLREASGNTEEDSESSEEE